ncbi:MAG: class I SAM-dependent methyltransferase [Deltaproteobacteria bacterium]|nr:class I SAM-dependent methyltransferase [Deltaproteobacteria bacterium]
MVQADDHEKKAGALLDASLASGSASALLQVAIAGSHRVAADKARDKYRHPLETLSFFGVKDNMTVVEVWPGRGGWYTDILAPFLKERGTYYAAGFDPDSSVEFMRNGAKSYKEKLAGNAAVFGSVKETVLSSPTLVDIAPAGSADMVLTFRNVHNWMANDQAANVFTVMFKALKPGGILGVVEHRGNPATPQDPKAASGYVNEDVVIKMAEAAGFKLEGKSEINANPKDTKDYPQGVWTLSPVLRLKEVDKEKYLAIGESDRMTLKFVKPTK